MYAPHDHLMAVYVSNDQWTLVAGEKKFRLPMPSSYVSFYPAELSWAPDGNAFYITQSDATSEIDGFHTEVFTVSDARANPGPDITQEVLARFHLTHRCSLAFDGGVRYDDSDANIAGLAWADGSSQLVVVAEVPPDSSCGTRGYFGGYLVRVTDGKILRTYSPLELHRRWRKAFGIRLISDYSHLNTAARARLP
jgi:hypothetical protein